MTDPNRKIPGSSLVAGASALLSVAMCYGTLALLAVLSMFGVSLVLNDQVWAGLIVAFAVLAALAVFHGHRDHNNPNPARLAVAGAALVYWAMYGAENIRAMLGLPGFVVELAGFAALLGAAWWDWRLQRPDVS